MGKRIKNLSTVFTLFMSCLVLASCTLGPDYVRPKTVADRSASFLKSNGVKTGLESYPGRWWERFGDETAVELVNQALTHNTDIKIAAARVLEMAANFRIVRGGRFPQFVYSMGLSRSKISFVLPQTGRIGIFSTTYSNDLTASYQLDLFGKLARAQQAAWSNLLAAEADRETVLHTVISSVVRSRVRVSTLKHQLALSRANVESWEKTLKMVERRYSRGVAGSLDLRLARENLAFTRASTVTLEEILEIACNSLGILIGRHGITPDVFVDTLPDLPPLEPVPLGLPASLLDRRPDIRAAEMRLAAATANVGVAIAELFPDLSLTGNAGHRSDDLKNLITSEGLVYSAVVNLLTPVFTGGRITAQVKAAKARLEQASAAYAKTILTALSEVENALVREEKTRRRITYLQSRLEEAKAAENLARNRYQQGVERFLTVLETERRRRLAENDLVVELGAMWNTRIDLFLALGGDWKIGHGKKHENRDKY